ETRPPRVPSGTRGGGWGGGRYDYGCSVTVPGRLTAPGPGRPAARLISWPRLPGVSGTQNTDARRVAVGVLSAIAPPAMPISSMCVQVELPKQPAFEPEFGFVGVAWPGQKRPVALFFCEVAVTSGVRSTAMLPRSVPSIAQSVLVPKELCVVHAFGAHWPVPEPALLPVQHEKGVPLAVQWPFGPSVPRSQLPLTQRGHGALLLPVRNTCE